MPGPIRFGLIGLGRWGAVYVRTISALDSRCRLTHLVTRHPERAALVPYPVTVLADWRQVISADCDAIIIATPPSTHAEMLEACLEAGKPVIVEKPLCLDLGTAERLNQLVRASGTPVIVDHTQLFNPAYIALQKALADAGEPMRNIIAEGMGLGPFRVDVTALWDYGPHSFSLCLDLVGEKPRHLAALSDQFHPHDAAEMVSVRLDFPSGTCAWINMGRLAPQKRSTLTVLTDTKVYVFDDRASQKLMVAPREFSGEAFASRRQQLEWTPIGLPSQLTPMESFISYFLNGLTGGDRRRFGTDFAVEVIRLLARCGASTMTTSGGSQPIKTISSG